jgi:hypothetical protein
MKIAIRTSLFTKGNVDIEQSELLLIAFHNQKESDYALGIKMRNVVPLPISECFT